MRNAHYLDLGEDLKIPSWEENKKNGYKMAICGYQRKDTTLIKNKVTCKQCLKLMS